MVVTARVLIEFLSKLPGEQQDLPLIFSFDAGCAHESPVLKAEPDRYGNLELHTTGDTFDEDPSVAFDPTREHCA